MSRLIVITQPIVYTALSSCLSKHYSNEYLKCLVAGARFALKLIFHCVCYSAFVSQVKKYHANNHVIRIWAIQSHHKRLWNFHSLWHPSQAKVMIYFFSNKVLKQYWRFLLHLNIRGCFLTRDTKERKNQSSNHKKSATDCYVSGMRPKRPSYIHLSHLSVLVTESERTYYAPYYAMLYFYLIPPIA